MISSKVAICNAALSHLGIDPIITLDDNIESARRCKQIYDILEQSLLRSHDWSFASAYATLNVMGDRPDEYSPYKYQVLQEILAIREVCADIALSIPITYTQNGDYIYTYDVSDVIYLRYTKYSTALPYDAVFANVLSLQIAAMTSKPLTGSVRADLYQMADKVMKDAVGTDNRVSQLKVRKKSSWSEAR